MRTVRLVLLPNAVALDLVRGTTRLARMVAPRANPRGELLTFDEHPGVIGINWRNPGGTTESITWILREGTIALRDG